MNEQEKQDYLEKYNEAKKKGEPFFPDALFKDALVSLVIFIALVALAYFVGAPLEERANPADTSYTPRPEWYFLFLFQLLKYFPGKLEVIGVFLLPTLAIILLLALPLLDRSPRRHPRNRLIVIIVTSSLLLGFVVLTVLAVREAPPPVEAAGGDPVAALYTKNCAPCHGPTISVAPGTKLHDIIAQGSHQGMPSWSGDLTSDQIDALAGFILSPGGSKLFNEHCGACHEVSELVSSDPLELKKALDEGQEYQPHAGVDIPEWSTTLSQEEKTTLLNFLLAPDGQRLFAINCAPCHGQSVKFTGEENGLAALIKTGGMHLDMPPWQEKLSGSELEVLARYVVQPSSEPAGEALFEQYCSKCHGNRVPVAKDVPQAEEIIAKGGIHQTMPVWGNLLTSEQVDALVKYTLEGSKGTPLELGQELFAANCAICHGDLGEGGPNPVLPGDIIAPISSAEFLKTRDDFTLRSIISQGQPNFGMSPFGTSFGGPLEDDEVDAIIAFMRAWEQNPPVEQPPEISVDTLALSGSEIYQDLCSQCHGENGEGAIGPSLSSPQFQTQNSDQEIFDTINLGHKATAMIGWGEILNADQIQELVKFIRQLEPQESSTPSSTPAAATKPTQESSAPTSTPAASANPTFEADVLPIFQKDCIVCHGSMGGWDGSSYQSAMSTGDHAPVIIPGDVEGSLLAQKILGTHTEGLIMPPSGMLPEDIIQIILNWIAAGAPEN